MLPQVFAVQLNDDNTSPHRRCVRIIPQIDDSFQIFLFKRWVQVDVNLAQWSDRDEFVFLTGANDQNVSGTSIEFPSVYGPARVPLNHINNLIVAMTVEHWTTAYLRNHHEHRNAEAAGSRADKFIRGTHKWQVSLMDRFHIDWTDWTGAWVQESDRPIVVDAGLPCRPSRSKEALER
jgi:hypothetical protein